MEPVQLEHFEQLVCFISEVAQQSEKIWKNIMLRFSLHKACRLTQGLSDGCQILMTWLMFLVMLAMQSFISLLYVAFVCCIKANFD